MSVTAHVSDQLSAAYDGDLDAEGRSAFDAHIAACGACAGAWAEFGRAVDAVRALPMARMPHPVRLPAGPPLPDAAAEGAVHAWLRRTLGRPAVSVAAVAAVALGIGLGVSRPASQTALAPAPQTAKGEADRGAAAGPPVGATPMASAAAGDAAAPAAVAAACPVTPLPAGASMPGNGGNTVSYTSQGTTLVLSVGRRSYHPGDTVPVIARASTASGLLQGCVSVAGLAPPQPGPEIAGGPTQQVTIPVSTPPGRSFQIVAVVRPPGQSPLEISLVISVD
jgi:hypothetical protein